MYTGEVINIKLSAGNLTNPLIGTIPDFLNTPYFLTDRTDIGGEQLIQVALKRRLFQAHILDNGIIGGTGFLVLVQFQYQFIEPGNRGLDVLVFNIDGHREKLIIRIGIGEFHQILSVGNLSLESFDLLRGFNALGEICLAVVLQVE